MPPAATPERTPLEHTEIEALCAGGRAQLANRMPGPSPAAAKRQAKPDTLSYGVPVSTVPPASIREVAGRKIALTVGPDGNPLGQQASAPAARFRVQTTEEAMKIMALAMFMEEEFLEKDLTRKTLQQMLTHELVVFALARNVAVTSERTPYIRGNPHLVLRTVLYAPDEMGGRPLRFGFDVLSSIQGLHGCAAALRRACRRAQRETEAAPPLPPLPSYAGQHVYTTLPLTVCYGLDYLQPLDHDDLTAAPTPEGQYARSSPFACHNAYRPRVAAPMPCAPGLNCDFGSIATLDLSSVCAPADTKAGQADDGEGDAAARYGCVSRVPNFQPVVGCDDVACWRRTRLNCSCASFLCVMSVPYLMPQCGPSGVWRRASQRIGSARQQAQSSWAPL